MTIPIEVIFPEGVIKHNKYLDYADGTYEVVGGVGIGQVTVTNRRLCAYTVYRIHNREVPHIRWSFKYDKQGSIFREFPLDGIPETLFCCTPVSSVSQGLEP